MNFIKTVWGKILTWIGYFGIFNKTRQIIDTFPGMENQENVRLWTIQQADNFLPVVQKTKNTIDDKIVISIRTVALNEKAFAAIFNLMVLAWEMIPRENDEPLFGEVVPQQIGSFLDAVERDEVGNPLLFIAVAGLLLQVIIFIKVRRNKQ